MQRRCGDPSQRQYTVYDGHHGQRNCKTHCFGGGLGLAVILTVRTPTRPSIAVPPLRGTVVLWFTPMLVFESRPETYATEVSYVYPAHDVEPLKTDALVSDVVGIV